MVKKKNKSKNNVSKDLRYIGKWHATPLKGSFMITAILGFLISAYWVYPQSTNYSIAFMIIFATMFVASLISMTKAPILNKGDF